MPRSKTPRSSQTPPSSRGRRKRQSQVSEPKPPTEGVDSGSRAEPQAPPAESGERLALDPETVTASQLHPRAVPDATYRVQFNRRFNFQQAAGIVDYLHELGVSALYASPLFQAGLDSTHGYDICRFDQLNPNLGAAADFEFFSGRLSELGMGLLLDMVPNHMGADLANAWWLDVLEKGQASPFAAWFDIDWQPLKSDFHGQVLVPVLEDLYGKVLEGGKLQLRFEKGAFWVAYYDRLFPVSPESYPELLQSVRRCGAPDSEGFEELRKLVRREGTLSAELDSIKEQLGRLQESSPAFRDCVDSALRQLNGTRGDPRSFDTLDRLLRKQHYRLAYWRVGREEINYRRFLDATELVSVRMELPQAFEQSHQLVARLLQEGRITGLRIDHPDGLWNPTQYFERLQAVFGAWWAPATSIGNGVSSQSETHTSAAASGADGSSAPGPLYIIAEKILSGDEGLPTNWPVAGTSGYDFLNRMNRIFVNRAGRKGFDVLYRKFTDDFTDFAAAVHAGKLCALNESLISEHNALTQRLKAIAVATRSGQDLTYRQLHAALAEIIAGFPVYRTYITEETTQPASAERDYIIEAVQAARARNPSLDNDACDFIQKLLLLDLPSELDSASLNKCKTWVMKFQQLTGPVMAKGLEGTACYNYNRLLSLNEVGGDASIFGASLLSFHEYNRRQAESWPHSLLATATHDTKWGEDLRARLNVLSEVPSEWHDAVYRWSQLNASRKSTLDAAPAPHPSDEYLFYQTLVGAWLPEAESAEGLGDLRNRLVACTMKALKEAKARTSWTNPNSAYEEATRHFVESALADPPDNPFLDDFKPFQRRIAFFGTFNSLSQVLLKMTCPGVPDFYQGTELWDFNLVDPDNRRPVDYALRREMLAAIKAGAEANAADLRPWLAELLQGTEDGRVKLYLIWRTLNWRRTHKGLFDGGNYVPLDAQGAKPQHVCAFSRALEDQQAITVVPRRVVGLTGENERLPLGAEIWDTTSLAIPESQPGAEYHNVLTGERLKVTEAGLLVAEVLSSFPVALLERIPG